MGNLRKRSYGSQLRGMFDGPVRTAVSALWFFGTAFAASAAVLSAAHSRAGSFVAFVLAAVALAALAIALLRSHTWAMAVSFVLLAGQIVGVLGTASQLAYGIDAHKGAELVALGVDPRAGVAVNLAYSLVAFAVFVAALVRLSRRERR